jgi:hypothetical protein
MYTALGLPKTFQTNLDEEHNSENLISFSISLNENYFVQIDRRSLFIFQQKPTVLVASICRNDEDIKEYGTNEVVEWGPSSDDQSFIVVSTSTNSLLIFIVEFSPNNNVLSLLCENNHFWGKGTGEGNGIIGVSSFSYYSSISLFEKIHCFKIFNDLVVVSVDSGLKCFNLDSGNTIDDFCEEVLLRLI